MRVRACLWVCSRRPTCPCLLNGESRSTECMCWRQRMQLWRRRGCIFFFSFTFFSVFIVRNETRSRTRAWKKKNTSKNDSRGIVPVIMFPNSHLLNGVGTATYPKLLYMWVENIDFSGVLFFFFFLAPAFRKRPDNGFGLTQRKKKLRKEGGRTRRRFSKVNTSPIAFPTGSERHPHPSATRRPMARRAAHTVCHAFAEAGGEIMRAALGEWRLPHSYSASLSATASVFLKCVLGPRTNERSPSGCVSPMRRIHTT